MFKSKYEKNVKKKIKEERGSESVKSSIDTDPLGMWTGVPDDPYDLPVQDADDL